MLRANVYSKTALSFMLGVAGCLATVASGAEQPLADTPPMGWNSWDSYGLTVTEAQFKSNVLVEATRLKAAGFRYAVVDEGWYLANPEIQGKPEQLQYRMDGNGRYEPALNRFPTAEERHGFRPMADFVHGQGLKFGIHIIRGVPKKAVAANLAVANSSFHATDLADTTDTCPWNTDNYGVKNNAAGQAWYDALLSQYAGWGVDYIKVDCIASHPYKGEEIAMIHKAILKTGRPMVLSLSPGPAPLDKAVPLGENAQLWRISEDVWDRWEKSKDSDFPQGVKNQFPVIASWTKHVKPGNWPDADMLPFGSLGPVPGLDSPRQTKLTHDEQRTLLTLWSIARSPLFFGGNLTQLDDWTASLLTNTEVIAMDQHGRDQHQATAEDGLISWTSQVEDGTIYLALFNVSDSAATVQKPFPYFGLARSQYKVRDVWSLQDMPTASGLTVKIAPHGCALFALRP